MKVHEIGTFLIITALIFMFSGALGKMWVNEHQRDCFEANATLLAEQKEGPLNECK